MFEASSCWLTDAQTFCALNVIKIRDDRMRHVRLLNELKILPAGNLVKRKNGICSFPKWGVICVKVKGLM